MAGVDCLQIYDSEHEQQMKLACHAVQRNIVTTINSFRHIL